MRTTGASAGPLNERLVDEIRKLNSHTSNQSSCMADLRGLVEGISVAEASCETICPYYAVSVRHTRSSRVLYHGSGCTITGE